MFRCSIQLRPLAASKVLKPKNKSNIYIRMPPSSNGPAKAFLQTLPKELQTMILKALYDRRIFSLPFLEIGRRKCPAVLNWRRAMKADKDLFKASMVCHSLRGAASSVLDDHCHVVAEARAGGVTRMRGWNFDRYGIRKG